MRPEDRTDVDDLSDDASPALRARRRWSSAARPKKFTSNRDLACLTEDSSAPPKRPRPALLAQRSIRPAQRQHLADKATLHAGVVGDIAMKHGHRFRLARGRMGATACPEDRNPALASAWRSQGQCPKRLPSRWRCVQNLRSFGSPLSRGSPVRPIALWALNDILIVRQ